VLKPDSAVCNHTQPSGESKRLITGPTGNRHSTGEVGTLATGVRSRLRLSHQGTGIAEGPCSHGGREIVVRISMDALSAGQTVRRVTSPSQKHVKDSTCLASPAFFFSTPCHYSHSYPQSNPQVYPPGYPQRSGILPDPVIHLSSLTRVRTCVRIVYGMLEVNAQ